MRVSLLIVIWSILLSCGNKKSDQKTEEAVSEVVMEESLQDTAEYLNKSIPVVNFEALQSRYLQKENDTTYVINFWATWCKPCIKELPAFEKITSDYADKKVKVLLVSLDFPDKLEGQVIPFIIKNDISSKVILLDDADANGWIPKVSPEWSGAIPATVIYKKDNRKFYERSFTFKEVEIELKIFLQSDKN